MKKMWVIIVAFVLFTAGCVIGILIHNTPYEAPALAILGAARHVTFLVLVVVSLYGLVMAVVLTGALFILPRFLEGKERIEFLQERPARFGHVVVLAIPCLICLLVGVWVLNQI